MKDANGSAIKKATSYDIEYANLFLGAVFDSEL